MIQSEGARAGVVINPATPVSVLDEVLEFVDYVLVMSVNPGFGAQRFIPNALRKIRALDCGAGNSACNSQSRSTAEFRRRM